MSADRYSIQDLTLRQFGLVMAAWGAGTTQDGCRWLDTDRWNRLFAELSGGDIRRLSADTDRLMELGAVEFRSGPTLGPDRLLITLPAEKGFRS